MSKKRGLLQTAPALKLKEGIHTLCMKLIWDGL